MARIVNRLSDRTVRTVTGPGRFPDGGGLYLVVDPSGARRWLFRYRSGTREREAGLGGFPTISLAEARKRRDEARQHLASGRDPIEEKRKAGAKPVAAVTFGAFVDSLLPELAGGFRNAKHAAQWASTLATYAADLRPKPIAEIDTDDLLTVLRPIWSSKAETASRVRGRIERVLDAARAKGLRSGENPARWRGHLDQLLPKRKRLTRGHHAALPFAEVPPFVVRLRERSGTAALGLEYLILTAARTGEVIGARWEEVDVDGALWTVPAARMKGGREHRVPLVERAVEILRDLQVIRRGEFVFPSFVASKHLSDGAFDRLLDRMKVSGATPHGFRSSFRDWAGELTDHPREVVEAALAHVVGDETERAYRRGDALEKRRRLMTDWAQYVS